VRSAQRFGHQGDSLRQAILPSDFLSFDGYANKSMNLSGWQRRTVSRTFHPIGRTHQATGNDSAEPRSFSGIELGRENCLAEAWHLWIVIVPRRTVAGRLVLSRFGGVTTADIGFYKKFVEYDDVGR
jgi:hypothetical protein